MPEQDTMQSYGDLSELSSRIRMLENKYNTIRERLFLINQNMIDEYKKIIEEIRSVNMDIREVKNDIFNIKETLKHIIKDMELFAKKENLKVVEKYINMWNPLNFVTQQEITELMKGRRKHGKNK